jgi:hypothetical protein
MTKLRRIILTVISLYVVTLAWGYARLPWAAIKSLRDFRNIARASAVSFDGLDVTPVQEWYLKKSLPESPKPVVPRLSVEVKWYALVLARAYSTYYVSPKGAEGRDSLYFCFFGAWIPVYNFQEWMS